MMINEHASSGHRPVLAKAFFERLDQIRARGHEGMPSGQKAGVFNVSAPVLGPHGRAIAALTVPYVTLVNASQAPHAHGALSMLVKTARKLSGLPGADPARTSLGSNLNIVFPCGTILGTTACEEEPA